jgi:hypothetical protein
MNTQYRLKCNRHLLYNDGKKSFQDCHLTQESVTTVSVKRRSKSDTGTYSSFDKMMSKTEKKKSTNTKKSKVSVQCQSRRTSSGRATSEDNPSPIPKPPGNNVPLLCDMGLIWATWSFGWPREALVCPSPQ